MYQTRHTQKNKKTKPECSERRHEVGQFVTLTLSSVGPTDRDTQEETSVTADHRDR